jgi:transcriptional regulator with XRE-family HTH domain
MSERTVPGPTAVELGRHLRELRLALGLDAEQLAERGRLSAEVIAELELGQHDADVDTLRALADALGIRLSVIFMLWEARAFECDGDQRV